jgi:hypothetical protein
MRETRAELLFSQGCRGYIFASIFHHLASCKNKVV